MNKARTTSASRRIQDAARLKRLLRGDCRLSRRGTKFVGYSALSSDFGRRQSEIRRAAEVLALGSHLCYISKLLPGAVEASADSIVSNDAGLIIVKLCKLKEIFTRNCLVVLDDERKFIRFVASGLRATARDVSKLSVEIDCMYE
jgi:hypothetical protein